MPDENYRPSALHALMPEGKELSNWLSAPAERFDIPHGIFDAYAYVVRGRRYLFAVSRDHHPPEVPAPESVGLPVLRLQHKYLKLTTTGAMLWGPYARRNVVELDDIQIRAYLGRRSVSLREDQRSAVSGRGFVIVRWRGLTAGVGLFRPEEAADLKSLYPAARARGGPSDATRGGS